MNFERKTLVDARGLQTQADPLRWLNGEAAFTYLRFCKQRSSIDVQWEAFLMLINMIGRLFEMVGYNGLPASGNVAH